MRDVVARFDLEGEGMFDIGLSRFLMRVPNSIITARAL